MASGHLASDEAEAIDNLITNGGGSGVTLHAHEVVVLLEGWFTYIQLHATSYAIVH